MKTENNFKISLLIPTYNSGATLSKTLDSVRQQSLSNVEVILIDGGSTDNTLMIVEANRDLISIVVSETDKGIYDAINKGVGLASGTLISVLGSDDMLYPDALEAIYSVWSTSPTDIIAGQTVMVSPDETESMRIDEDYGIGALLSGIPFGHNAMYVTREAYKRVGDYDLRYRICADADWVHRAIRLGCTCAQIEVPVVRFSLGGLSSNSTEDIMRETYQTIANNFTGLTIEDAKIMLYAIRGWSDDNEVNPVLYKYRHNSDFINAAGTAFNARAQRLGKPVPIQAAAATPATLWQAIIRRIPTSFRSLR